MTIVNSLKLFFNKLNGQTPSGNNIAEVIRNGTTNVELNNESSIANRTTTLESTVGALTQGETALPPRVSTLEGSTVQYEDETKTSFTLKSSTDSSTKEFKITITDDGTISATEIATEIQ